jgi:hypothetical protein
VPLYNSFNGTIRGLSKTSFSELFPDDSWNYLKRFPGTGTGLSGFNNITAIEEVTGEDVES